MRRLTNACVVTIPQYGGAITINGHQSKILVTDFAFGDKTLLYSTAEVLTYSILDNKPVLVLWLPSGETGEFAILGSTSAKATSAAGTDATNISGLGVHSASDSVTVSYTQGSGVTIIELEDGTRVVLVDRSAAYLFWVPTLGNDPFAPENETVLVQGPYLVRSAEVCAETKTLELTGDLGNGTTNIIVFAPSSVEKLSWNGKEARITSSNGGLLTADLQGLASFSLPSLGTWKYFDSLPEIWPNYTATSVAWVGKWSILQLSWLGSFSF
jgi:hypothetical protein